MERFAKNRKLFSQKAQLLRSDRVMNVPLVGRTSDGIIHSPNNCYCEVKINQIYYLIIWHKEKNNENVQIYVFVY